MTSWKTHLRRMLALVLALFALLVAAVGIWYATHRDEARGWRQAAVIGASLAAAHDNGDSFLVEVLGEDVADASVLEAGGLPATLHAPDTSRPRPAIVLFVPSGTDAAEEQDLVDVQRSLAAAGYRAWAVRTPALSQLLVDDAAGDQLVAAIDDIGRFDGMRGQPISIAAVGPAASLVLHAAATGQFDADIPAILAVQPIADVRGLLRRALTDPAIEPDLRADAGRALALAARSQLGDRAPIVGGLLDAAADAEDPIAALRRVPRRLAPGSLAPVLRLLDSTTTAEFDAAWSGLSQPLRDRVERHAPLPVAAQVEARVLLVDDPAQGPALRDGVAELQTTLPDARTIEVPADVDQADTRALLAVSAWWLQRAGA